MSIKGKDITVFKELSVEDSNKFIKDREKQYVKTANGFECKKCGSVIQQITLYISIHEKAFSGCAGMGEVRRVPYPYCPRCEGKPEAVRGCVHV